MYHVLFENLTWGQHLAVMKAAADAGADGEPKSHGIGMYAAPPAAEVPPALHPVAVPAPHPAPAIHAQTPTPPGPHPPLTHT